MIIEIYVEEVFLMDVEIKEIISFRIETVTEEIFFDVLEIQMEEVIFEI